MGRALALAAAVLALAAPALASAANPRLPSPLPPEPRLSKAEATRIFLANDKVSDLRRPPTPRNLARLALLSFSVSFWYFNRGDVFTSVPLVYPPLLYLLGRMVWSCWRGRLATGAAPVWPVWLLAAATVFTAGF